MSVAMYEFSRPAVGDGRPHVLKNAKFNVEEDISVIIHVTNITLIQNKDYAFFVPIPATKVEPRLLSGYYEHQRWPDYFVVELLLTAGGRPIRFSLADICLRVVERNRRVCPSEWLPSTLHFTEGLNFGSLCQNAFNLRQTELRNHELTPAAGADEGFTKVRQEAVSVDSHSSLCAALKYRVRAPHPRETFVLELGEAKVGDKTINLPAVRYVPDSFKGRGFPGA